ncbi:hexose phosphate transporter [Mycoplasma sp. AC1221]|uniref:hexose phosphate transporter n=1 Tax=Mycoplasma sp. 6243 TaxID=3440865 RepID=UPI003EBC4F7C
MQTILKMLHLDNIESMSPKKKLFYGLLLWISISFGYTLFVVNFGFSGLLNGGGKGTPGVLGHFNIENNAAFQLTNQATNWGITIGRGIGSILVAVILTRLAHRWTVIIAFILTLIGIPAQWIFPASQGGYVGFVIFRTLMAIGGTMLIILTQPVVARFFNAKTKSIVSQFGIWFFPLGSIITVVTFLAANPNDVKSAWQIIFTVISALNIIPLLIFIFVGSRFGIKTAQERAKEPNPFVFLWMYLKKKQTYIWILVYGGWLCAVVLPQVLSKRLFIDLTTLRNFDKATKEIASAPLEKLINIWLVIYWAAVFLGPITIGLWSRFKLKRKLYQVFALTFGILFYIFSMVVFTKWIVPSNGSIGSQVIFYIFAFITGLCLWGIQGVMLNLPHEYPERDPQTIGWMFSLIWGFGYLMFTVGLIIISAVTLIGKSVNPVAAGQVDPNTLKYSIIQFILIIVFGLISVLGTLLLREPDPNAESMPSWMKKIFGFLGKRKNLDKN